MEKKDPKKFDRLSKRLQQALNEFESIKNLNKQDKDKLLNESKAQKTLIKNIKHLINDLS